jgi:AraC-like DNA-binding protein
MLAREDATGFRDASPIRLELVRKLRRYLGPQEHRATEVPGLEVFSRSAPTPATSRLYAPSLGVILQGRKRIELGDEIYDCERSGAVLTSLDSPVVAQVTEASVETPYVACLLKLDIEAARQVIVEHDRQGPAVLRQGRATATGPVTAELLSAFNRLLELLDTPRDIPILGGLIQREILYRLLTSEQGARLREIVSSGSQSSRIAAAIAWLRQNYRQPLRIRQLADIARMGVSTFHHHFRAMTAMSPLQYQKRFRLHEARRLMLTQCLDAGSAALEVGYESATQFNREYRRLFGRPPLRDVKALRSRHADPVGHYTRIMSLL